MKQLLVFFVSILISATLWATGDCGMHATSTEAATLLQQRAFRQQLIAASKGADEGETIYIPVTAHIIRDNQGKQGYSEGDLYPLMCEVNQFFAPVNMYLYIKGDVRYVDDQSLFWTYDAGSLFEMINDHMNASYVDSTLNIYFCNFFPNPNGAGLCGAAPFPFMDIEYFNGRPAGVVMSKTCSQPGEKTLPHELGHHFNLLHTFQGSNSNSANFREHVTREAGIRNCETAGDGFCDTEADTLFYGCPYNGRNLDLRGEALRPDESLLMSYYSDDCQNRYSPEQLEEIRSVAYNDPRRNIYKFNNPVSLNTSPINGQTIAMRTPLNNTSVPWNNITFSWRPVPDANKYIVSITDASNGSKVTEIATKDTSVNFGFESSLVIGKRYNWRVQAYREGNTCFNNVFTRSFTAGQATSVAQNFLDASTIVLYPNPVSGPQEVRLSFKGERNAEATLQVTDLSGRIMIQQMVQLQQGNNEVIFPADKLPDGMYNVCLQDNSGVISRKMVIQR